MKVVALYHPDNEHARSVVTFERDFKVRSGHSVELKSLETVEGAEMANLYGITSYPALLVTTDAGELQKLWEGDQLPLIDEVLSYVLV